MCIFCQIVAGEISADIIYEDEKTLAFLDNLPVHPGHILVIPKVHVINLEDVPETDLMAVSLTVKKMGALIKSRLGYEGYNVITNNDPVANQVIPHLHFHLIPRIKNDNLNIWPQTPYQKDELKEILEKLKA
jgi:histidine triad (HIT) family protein